MFQHAYDTYDKQMYVDVYNTDPGRFHTYVLIRWWPDPLWHKDTILNMCIIMQLFPTKFLYRFWTGSSWHVPDFMHGIL